MLQGPELELGLGLARNGLAQIRTFGVTLCIRGNIVI